MKKSMRRIGCLVLSAVSVVSLLAGCKKDKEQNYDTETRAVVFATDALDGNFNPFFATSATDSRIAAMTQVGMLTTDKQGNPLCGEEEPTVALAYKQTMKNGNVVTTKGEEATTTEYEFLIKNGMKFSDGKPLTIKDVLFNLYVYLDPSYMGSATIYSTDIVGLQAYRTQDPEATDASTDVDAGFYAEADARIYAMLDYLQPETGDSPVLTEQIEADIATVKKLFREEAESDWTMSAGTQESYKDEYTFTEDWQIYYFNEGIISVQYEQGKPLKDSNGKYITSLDVIPEYAEEIEAAKNDADAIAKIMEEEGCSEEAAKEYAVRDFAIKTVYENYTEIDSNLAQVISYWATGSNARDEFAAEARTKYFEDIKKNNDGQLLVQSISGITTYKTSTDFNGKDLGEEHDVLKIVINGVDPKAIWNFAFSVAPMHYYSDAETIASTPFGVKFADKTFFDTVLQADEKNGLPVGAGVYKASKDPNTKEINKDTFYRDNWVYFERNTYFETMGGETITNAKIKLLRYRVVGSDKIIQALQAGNIDFGEPQATMFNITEIDKYKDTLDYERYATNGYGYVGINPKFVPDIEVRQAIMKAMNTASIVKNYYTEKLADVIYRPMSNTSWAYPKGCEEYESIAYTTNKQEIIDLVESKGWYINEKTGIREKDGEPLKITFTIAGETTDHPAYDMFMDAANVLNSCGFDVSVTTDITALKKLATGGLAVWAAAWNSTVDPDLYQVYHKDSKATSIKNWGYETIFADNGEQFGYEQRTIDKLSTLIEEARETLDESVRKEKYAQALDLIMDLAIELPTYQRNDLVVYNKNVIDASTLNQDPSANAGVYDRLWEVDYL